MYIIDATDCLCALTRYFFGLRGNNRCNSISCRWFIGNPGIKISLSCIRLPQSDSSRRVSDDYNGIPNVLLSATSFNPNNHHSFLPRLPSFCILAVILPSRLMRLRPIFKTSPTVCETEDIVIQFVRRALYPW